LQCKVQRMDSSHAAQHLEVIRTLMERSAIYRRALSPVMTLAGTIGIIAAGAGWLLNFEAPVVFTAYWLCVGMLGALSAFLLVRQQALKQKEPLFTPPARRIVQAMLPCLVIGFVLGIVLLAAEMQRGDPDVLLPSAAGADLMWLPLSWIMLYGCAIHASGAFTPRGLRLFGWIFITGGSIAFASWVLTNVLGSVRPQQTGHLLMGFFFGVVHLAYGAYLSATERKNGT